MQTRRLPDDDRKFGECARVVHDSFFWILTDIILFLSPKTDCGVKHGASVLHLRVSASSFPFFASELTTLAHSVIEMNRLILRNTESKVLQTRRTSLLKQTNAGACIQSRAVVPSTNTSLQLQRLGHNVKIVRWRTSSSPMTAQSISLKNEKLNLAVNETAIEALSAWLWKQVKVPKG